MKKAIESANKRSKKGGASKKELTGYTQRWKKARGKR